MEQELRTSARVWKVVAGVAMALGVVGSLMAADAAYNAEGRSVWIFIGVLVGSLLGVMLLLGVLFMGTRIMDGLAELITISRGGSPGLNRRCPSCAELMRAEATVCRWCGRELPPLEATIPPLIEFDHPSVVVRLAGVPPAQASGLIRAAIEAHPRDPIRLDFTLAPPGYDEAIGGLLNLFSRAEPGVERWVYLVGPAWTVSSAVRTLAEARGWPTKWLQGAIRGVKVTPTVRPGEGAATPSVLRPCPSCGKQVHRGAKRCPYCRGDLA